MLTFICRVLAPFATNFICAFVPPKRFLRLTSEHVAFHGDQTIFWCLLKLASALTVNGCHGPGYCSPGDAFRNGPREKLLYTTCIRNNITAGAPDCLATVDVDPQSATYCQVGAGAWLTPHRRHSQVDSIACHKSPRHIDRPVT